jgi:hypothetical protein
MNNPDQEPPLNLDAFPSVVSPTDKSASAIMGRCPRNLRHDHSLASVGRCHRPTLATRVTGQWIVSGEESQCQPKAPSFKTISAGTAVSWHYRSAIGYGTVTGVHKRGTTAANTMYSITEHDHHPGEPTVVFHSGKALTRARK